MLSSALERMTTHPGIYSFPEKPLPSLTAIEGHALHASASKNGGRQIAVHGF
jgi:hypothetical protein